MKKHMLIKKASTIALLLMALTKLRQYHGAWLPFSLILASFAMPMMAQASEQSVQAYANALQNAANNRNIGQIARLISDDVIISLSRQGRDNMTLSKADYLQLLQQGWMNTSAYRFDIEVKDVLIVGNQARAQMVSTETWTQDGKNFTLITTSKVTLDLQGRDALLLRSVAQVVMK